MSAEPNQLTIVPEADRGFLATLERLATNPNVPVETIERLLAVQERVMSKQAEDEFNTAMSAAQSEMGRISADATNPQTNSKYASYGQLDKALRPIYTKHGFALSFGEADSPKADHIRVVCYVTHRGGHTRMYHRDMPVVTTGLAGKVNMTQTHGNASAQSYAQRYLLKGIFNVAIGEDDNDGNGDRGEVITEKQVADLNALIDEVGANRQAFMEYIAKDKFIAAEKLEDIPVKSYSSLVKMLERKRKAKAPK
jgi:hypothetical protein